METKWQKRTLIVGFFFLGSFLVCQACRWLPALSAWSGLAACLMLLLCGMLFVCVWRRGEENERNQERWQELKKERAHDDSRE